MSNECEHQKHYFATPSWIFLGIWLCLSNLSFWGGQSRDFRSLGILIVFIFNISYVYLKYLSCHRKFLASLICIFLKQWCHFFFFLYCISLWASWRVQKSFSTDSQDANILIKSTHNNPSSKQKHYEKKSIF